LQVEQLGGAACHTGHRSCFYRKLEGGDFVVVIGLISLIFWWTDFLTIIRGALPIFLFLGGALAVYVGFDDIQDKIREERQRQNEELEKAREEIESAKAEAERYRDELDKLKDAKK